jgi:origin recognition complex subunit 2
MPSSNDVLQEETDLYRPSSSKPKYESLKAFKNTIADILRERNVYFIGDERRQIALVSECYKAIEKEVSSFREWLDTIEQYTDSHQQFDDDYGEDEGVESDSVHYFASISGRVNNEQQRQYEDKWERLWTNIGSTVIVNDGADVRDLTSGLDRSRLRSHLESQFKEWFLCLFNGFNLLLHGVGSKTELINTLASRVIKWNKETKCGHCFIISGYDVNLDWKKLFTSMCNKLDLMVSDQNKDQLLSTLLQEFSNNDQPEIDPLASLLLDDYKNYQQDDDYLYLFVHNLDGPGLRTFETHDYFSQLCHLKRVRLIASIDHVNANLLWDDNIDARYSFVRKDVTNYGLYRQESQFLRISTESQTNKTDYVTMTEHVLRSLTSKHVDLYITLLENRIIEGERIETQEQLARKENKVTLGMSLNQLKYAIMERYNLISVNDETVRGQLNGLKTHGIIKSTTHRGDIYYYVTNTDIRQCKKIHEQVIAKYYPDRVRLS